MRTKQTTPGCTDALVECEALWVATLPRNTLVEFPIIPVIVPVDARIMPLGDARMPLGVLPQRRRRTYGWSLQKKRNSQHRDQIFTLDAILGASWNKRTQKMRLLVRWAPSATGFIYKNSWITEDCVIGTAFCLEIARLRAKFVPPAVARQIV